jgi:hypothetical protein
MPVACNPVVHLIPMLWDQLERSIPKEEIIWEVNTAGSVSTRPVYSYSSTNVRNTLAVKNETVLKGTICLCYNKAIVEGTSTYCDVAGKPNAFSAGKVISANKIALCVRKS